MTIKAELLTLSNTDRDFADIARISFARTANDYSDESNAKLIKYLATSNPSHWLPMGHNRIAIETDSALLGMSVQVLEIPYNVPFITSYNEGRYIISSSIWGWLQAYKKCKLPLPVILIQEITRLYPILASIFGIDKLVWHQALPSNYYAIVEPTGIHQHFTFKCSAPVFVARQLGKHQVQFTWSEESRRYIKSDPAFYEIEQLRYAPDGSIKQGSGGDLPWDLNALYKAKIKDNQERCLDLYHRLLDDNIAPELARSVLPQDMVINWIWTGSIVGWTRLLGLRLEAHTQKETQGFASQIEEQLSGYL